MVVMCGVISVIGPSLDFDPKLIQLLTSDNVNLGRTVTFIVETQFTRALLVRDLLALSADYFNSLL